MVLFFSGYVAIVGILYAFFVGYMVHRDDLHVSDEQRKLHEVVTRSSLRQEVLASQESDFHTAASSVEGLGLKPTELTRA